MYFVQRELEEMNATKGKILEKSSQPETQWEKRVSKKRRENFFFKIKILISERQLGKKKKVDLLFFMNPFSVSFVNLALILKPFKVLFGSFFASPFSNFKGEREREREKGGGKSEEESVGGKRTDRNGDQNPSSVHA